MGEDLSTGAKIGIILIILVALIGIVFALLTMMKNITNSGSNQLQNSLDQMASSSINDYDQKKVSGTQVITAIKMFETQDIAIVVYPLMIETEAPTDAAGGFCYNALLRGYKEVTAESGAAGLKGIAKGFGSLYASTQAVNQFPSEGGVAKAEKLYKDNAADVENGLLLGDSKTYYVGKLEVDSDTTGEVKFNMNMRPLSASGNCTYIRDNATYRSFLIKDPSGTVIGICFTEMSKK